MRLHYSTQISIGVLDHLDNNMWVRAKDGYEAVEDDILVQGPDYRLSFILFGLGLTIVVAAAFTGNKKKKEAQTKVANNPEK